MADKTFGSSDGLTILSEDQATPANGMVAHVTSSWNSGYQNGDIKGAFLSSTDTASLVGSGELVTNGTFDTDTSGWTASAGFTLTQNAGVIDVTYDGVSGLYYVGGYQALTTVVGSTYTVTADVTSVDPSPIARFRIETNLGGGQHLNTNIGVGSYSWTFTAISTTTYLNLGLQANVAGTVSFDNISVKLADADRSVNNNGLIVNGTVTRSPVATGAELVGYSGFSASNYLEQPYNPDLDFGTGDFCVMWWTKGWIPAQDKNSVIARHGTNPLFIGKDSSTNKVAVFQTGRLAEVNSTSQLDQNSWSHVSVVRSGSSILFYINGALDATAGASNFDVSLADGVLQVGIDNGLFPNNGPLALLRISATAPTADQIAKIYEDEKLLFQTGAQATLYGSSDAVTALAHDQETDLLHVGTSAGRSVFKGLRRINNTTDAVTTAISAHDGLIAEQ